MPRFPAVPRPTPRRRAPGAITAAVLALPLMLAAAPPAPGAPQDAAADRHVEGALLGVLLHELGHAVIDSEAVPIFGQEEDAADNFVLILAEALYPEPRLREIITAVALSYRHDAAEEQGDPDLAPPWDIHATGAQRFYNTLCLFAGADPQMRGADLPESRATARAEGRRRIARAMDLPEERADSCAEEYAMARQSWGAVLDEIAGPGDSITLEIDPAAEGAQGARILSAAVGVLNAHLSLSTPLNIHLARCFDPNAYYEPEDREITVCSEYAPYLREQYLRQRGRHFRNDLNKR